MQDRPAHPVRAARRVLARRLSMTTRSRLHKWFARPLLEALEDRLAPAAFRVTSLLDDGSAGTLRSALTLANTDPGPDTIDFGVIGTIQLNGSALPAITGDVAITGPGAANLTVDAHGA